MNKKGFTMVELLVAVSILGIISLISVPLIRTIQMNQTNKKYITYLDNMGYAAKLYTDSYSEDLYGNHTNGCAIIKYEDLVKRNLLKDIDISDISCNSKYSLVKVVKYDKKYYYRPFIGCGTKEDGKAKNPDIFKPSQIEASSICSASSDQIIGIEGVPQKEESIENKNLEPKIRLVSETGVNKTNPPRLYYGYSYTKEPNIIGGKWNRVDFRIPTKKQQEPAIRQAKTQRFLSLNTLPTPPDETGDLYLVIRVDILEDLEGNSWKESGDNYIYLGPYRVDNEPPVFNTSTIKSSVSSYQSIKPQLNFNVTDEHFTPEDKLKICYTYDAEEVCKTPTDSKTLASLSGYEAYRKNKTLKNISKTYDGKDHTIKVVVSDAAGNVAQGNFTYHLAKSYKLSFNTDGGSACNPASIQQIENKAWNDTSVTDPLLGEHKFCTTKKEGYIFSGWFTEKNGKGTEIKANSQAKSNLMVYAYWKPLTVNVKFDCNGGTGGGNQTFTFGVSGQKFNKTCSRAGAILLGWKLDRAGTKKNYDIANGVADTWITKYAPEKTLYAHWNMKTVVVTYSCDGTENGEKETFTYGKANQKFGKKCPTKVGYTQSGWKLNKNGTSKNYTINNSVSNNWIDTNSPKITIYSHWEANPIIIKYNANKGTGTIADQTCYYNQTCKPTSSKFKRKGYSQDGWCITPDCKGGSISSFTATANLTLYAKWTAESYDCKAGQYLKKNTEGCTTCLKNYYCSGGKYSFNETEDRGINACPTGYKNTVSTGKSKNTDCYMSVAENHYVKTAKATTATACSVGTEKAAHKVYYNSTSSCTLKKYTLSYNANGGSGTVTSHQCEYNKACTLKRNTFSFSGNTWDGWSVTKNGTKLGSTIAITQATTVYARWKSGCKAGYYLPKNTHTCTICPKNKYCPGGTFDFNATKDQGINACPTGYGNTDSTGKSTNTQCFMNVADNYYVNKTKDTTAIHCKVGHYSKEHKVYYTKTSSCSPIKYTLSYNANGGSGTVASHQCEYNKACTLKSNTFSFSGHTWDGWSVTKNGTKLGSTIAITQATTVYARWKSTCAAGYYLTKNTNTCTICPKNKYCPGGTYSFNATKDQGVNSCPTGYGNTDSTGKSKNTQCFMNVADNYFVNKAKDTTATPCKVGHYSLRHKVYYTLTSSCSPKKYTLSYNANGGSGTVASQQCEYNKACTLKNNTFSFSGHTWDGWSVTKNGTKLGSTIAITQATTVYARWKSTCAAGYYLTKNTNTCTICPKNKYCPGGTYSFNASSDQGVNSCPTGYGNTDSTGKSKNTDCYMNVAKNYFVKTAKATTATPCDSRHYSNEHKVHYTETSSCSPINYTLTYDSNGGNACSPSTKTVAYGSAYGTLCTPTRDRYNFQGWYTAATGGTKVDENTKMTTTGAKIFAHWKSKYITFRVKINSGETFVASTDYYGSISNWTKDSNGILYRNGSLYEPYYSRGTATIVDLPNYGYKQFLNISKKGYGASWDSAWKCVSGCRRSNQTFSQGEVYTNLDDIVADDNIDGVIVISVNWRPAAVRIKFYANGGTIVNSPLNPSNAAFVGSNGKYYIDNSNGRIFKGDQSDTHHELAVGASLSSNGLMNYNNPDFVEISTPRGKSKPDKNKEWKEVSGCKKSVYSQYTVYNSSDFCKPGDKDCVCHLEVNWQ